MTVFDFVELCIDRNYCAVEIFDIGNSCSWKGDADEIPYELKGCTVLSYDPINDDCPRLVLNVETGLPWWSY